MIKIEITEDNEKVEVLGKRDDVIIGVGFALHSCIGILRECGRSNEFIEGMFKIALEVYEEKND